MAKRGRPRRNGVKEGWVLARALLALQGYGTPERLARSIPKPERGCCGGSSNIPGHARFSNRSQTRSGAAPTQSPVPGAVGGQAGIQRYHSH